MAPFPYMPMVALLASLVSYLVVQMNVFAYAGFMVEYLGAVDDKDKSGYYAGLLMSAFMLGLACSAHFWGLVSDRYGSRFVMVCALVCTVVLSVAFGLSTSFVWAFTFRFLLGLLNGIMAASKTLVSELCGKEHETVGMGVVTTSSTIGVVLGPGVGGVLAEPARHHPRTFSEGGIFGRNPYLLPNLVGAGLALLALPLVLIYLEGGPRAGRGDTLKRDEDGLEFSPGERAVQRSVDSYHGGVDNAWPPSNLEDVQHVSTFKRVKAWTISWWRQNGKCSRHDDQGSRDDADLNDRKAAGASDPMEGDKEEGGGVVPRPTAKSVGIFEGYSGRQEKKTTRPMLDSTDTVGRGRPGGSGEVAEVLRNSTGEVIKPASLMSEPHIRYLLTIFGLYSFQYSGFDEVFTLWALSSVAKGGLDWSTLQIGQVFLVCGLLILVFEIFAVPNLTPRLGVRTSQRIGSVFELPVYFLIPLLSRVSSDEIPVTVGAMIILFTVNVCTNSYYVGISLAISNATGADRRGELNGLSMSVSSFAKAMSPIACSSLFALSIDGDHPFPFDYHLVFYILFSLRLTVTLMGWYRIAGAENDDRRPLILNGQE